MTELLWKKEDLHEVNWVQEQTRLALADLQKEVLYTKEWDNVTFDVDTSIAYLQTLKDAKTWKEMVEENSGATIMAIQILLKNKWYELWKIDGILRTKWQATSKTMEAIKKFQSANWLNPDWIPGPETLEKLLAKYAVWWNNDWNEYDHQAVEQAGLNGWNQPSRQNGSPDGQAPTDNWWADKVGEATVEIESNTTVVEDVTEDQNIDSENKDYEENESITKEEFYELREKSSLTVDEAKKIVDYVKKYKEYLYLDWLTSIEPWVAEALAKHQGDLTLDWLTSIESWVAEALATHKDRLYLDWLTSIDKKVAKALAKHQGDLTLDWLTSIELPVAEALAKHQWTLSLDWLTSIEPWVAEALATHKDRLYLYWLKSIELPVAEALAKHQWTLYLRWLTSIEPWVAEALAKHQGDLALDWLTSIESWVAEALATHKDRLYLDWLTSIEPWVAKALAKHQWSLSLDWLKSMSDEVATELAKVKYLRINTGILTPEQKKILWK